MSAFTTALKLAALIPLAALAACSPYKLQGRVVAGDVSYAAIVDASDPRLNEGVGVPGIEVALWTDPEKLNRKRVAAAMSEGDGSFGLTVDEVGAGFLNYDCAVIAQGKGMAPVNQSFRLPPSSQRLLIIVRKGSGESPLPEDLMEEFRRFNR